jgi:hypothetical protein
MAVEGSDNGAVNTHKPLTPPEQQNETAESLDPNDSDTERDKWKGQTTEHATPPRLEDEGQSGG